MTRSIWSCSGAHWMRWGTAWTLVIAAIVNVGEGVSAETAPGRAGVKALREAAHAVPSDARPGTLVVTRIASFDFNRESRDGFGDAELETPQR